MYRYLAYYGRQGAGMQMISGRRHRPVGHRRQGLGQPVCKLLGARYRDRVRGLRLHPLSPHAGRR